MNSRYKCTNKKSITKRNNKAQTSMEFVILTSFMMLLFIVFFIIVQQRMSIIYQEKNDAVAQQLQNVVVNEIKLAESVSDGYYREFTLPSDLNGLQYNVSIIPGAGQSTEIVIKYSDKEKIYFLEEYVDPSSTIGIGLNNISKNSGRIIVQKKS